MEGIRAEGRLVCVCREAGKKGSETVVLGSAGWSKVEHGVKEGWYVGTQSVSWPPSNFQFYQASKR
jgi:hypothetical protein